MIDRTCVLWVALFLCGLAGRAAGVDVTVTRGGEVKAAIDLSEMKPGGGGQSAVFLQTLENDLGLSGWFTVVRHGGAPVAVRGSCEEGGGRVSSDCSVLNRSTGKGYFRRTFTEANGRALAHRVADAIVEAVKGVPGIASTRIALVGVKGGKKDLYLCDADGGSFVQITQDGTACRTAPAWTPDGRSVYYTGFLRGWPDVHRIDLDGMRRKSVASFPGLNSGADISPDGREMVLTLSKDGNPELYIMDIVSRALSRVTRTAHAAEASPSWSPDGKSIVFVSDKAGSPQLYVIDRAGRGEKRISFRGSENVAPDWGSNGWIVYTSRRGGRYVIYALDPVAGMEQQVSPDDADYEDPSWAPDGRHVVCARSVRYRSEVYLLDTKGDAPIRLTRFDGDWYAPAWSPK